VQIRSVHRFGEYVPSWLKRPVGCSFGFGGRLYSFTGPAEPPAEGQPAPFYPKTVRIDQITTESSLVDRAEAFQQALDGGDYLNFCDDKIAQARTDSERSTWQFMKTLFSDSAARQAAALQFLGYEPAKPPPPSDQKLPDNLVVSKPAEPLVDENAFFDSFNAPEASETSESSSDVGKHTPNGVKPDANGKVEAPAPETEDDVAIRKALIVGDFHTAGVSFSFFLSFFPFSFLDS
jgi:protein transport protein SEC31